MRKYIKYIEWLPFAVCLGALIIYLVYTIQIKMNPALIVTDKLISTLKTYLIIALVFLFIGLLIILIKKIYILKHPNFTIKEKKVKTKKVKPALEKAKEEKIVVSENDIIKEVVEETVYTIDDKKDYTFKLDAVACPECNGLISKDAAICPHCGILFDEELLNFLERHKNKISKVEKVKYVKSKPKLGVIIANICLIVLFIFLIFLVSNLLINKANENKNNITAIKIVDIEK